MPSIRRRRGLAAVAAALLTMAAVEAPAAAVPDAPAWLAERARAAGDGGWPGGIVLLFEVEGRPLYYVPPRCCDIPAELYDAEGALLCKPHGGFADLGDGRCPAYLDGKPLSDGVAVWPRPGP